MVLVRIVMLASLLVVACGGSESGAPPVPAPKSERSEPAPEREAEPVPVPAPTGPAAELRWQLHVGDAWVERNTERMFLLAHPKVPPDPAAPVSTITRTERFEVLEAEGEQVRMTVTVTDVVVEVREDGKTSVYRSDDPTGSPMDLLAARERARVGVPLQAWVSLLGAVTRVHEFEAYETTILARFDELSGSLPAEDREFERKQIVSTLERQPSSMRTRGLRPVLPADAVAVGSRWVHPMQLPSLMDSTVNYGLTYTPRAIGDDAIVVDIAGTGAVEPSAMLAALLESSEFRIVGSLQIDARRGVLVEHEEAIHMRVEFRDNPIVGSGGLMASRLERHRVRLESGE